MNRRTLALLGALLLPATSGANQGNQGLAFCARLESIDERLACYDEVARASESAQGWPVDSSPTPSHRLGNAAARRPRRGKAAPAGEFRVWRNPDRLQPQPDHHRRRRVLRRLVRNNDLCARTHSSHRTTGG
jgi:hypothetical protein